MKLATYAAGDTFDHKAADGFLKIYGLPFKTLNIVQNSIHKEVQK